MEHLLAELTKKIEQLQNPAGFYARLDDLFSVYPFNEYEFIISTLLGSGIVTLNEYYELRDEYLARNMYLHLFEISAPRGFGERWAQGHLKELVPELQKPSRKLDPDYSGQYDFFLIHQDRQIRIEVKASRAVDFTSKEPLYVKALSSDSDKQFDMNFQQLKPDLCDVFIWVAVWRDVIRYWVLSANDVKKNQYYSPGQHRGNIGEGQLHIKHENIKEFAQYESRSNELYHAIIDGYIRQIQHSKRNS